MNIFYNVEAERTLLGTILLEGDKIKDLSIEEGQFYEVAHNKIFKVCKELDNLNEIIDLITVTTLLSHQKEVDNIGGVSYLSALANSVASTRGFKYHEKIIVDCWRKRQALISANDLKSSVENGESLDESIQKQISNLLNLTVDDNQDDGEIRNALISVYQDLEKPKGDVTGMDTGFTELNKILSGLQPQDLVIIGARPSVGKTAFCLNIANNIANKDLVGIFSLEMSKESLLKRLISINGNINSQSIRTSTLSSSEWTILSNALAEIERKQLKIFDKAGVTVNYIWSKVRKLRQDYPEKRITIIIDYLQLIRGHSKFKGNRQAEISEISMTLKTMARELNVCVLALSQLSRGVEQRQDKRPMMSDLRESGQIEQDFPGYRHVIKVA